MEYSRVLPLDGGINFRDLGGYKTEDGRELQWRKIFRCGHLRDLSDADIAALKELGVSQIHDFRREEEQQWMVNRDLSANVYGDYQINLGSLSRFWQLLQEGDLDWDSSHQMVVGSYRDCLDDVAPVYKQFFDRLLDGFATPNTAAVFHCTAGKDRTGLAAALVLGALDVPRETIVQDYLLTLEHFDVEALIDLVEGHLVNAGTKTWERKWLLPYCAVHEDNINAFLNSADAQFGGLKGYLKNGIGLEDDAIELLRGSLLHEG